MLEATDLVGDLWSAPAYLRMCAPWLDPDEARRLQPAHAQAWTVADLPLRDAARQRLGDPQASGRKRRRDAAAAERERMARVVDDLLAADDDGEGVVTMLRGQDLRDALVDDAALPGADPDRLAGPFAHIVVDEAQELTDAEWQMLLGRCPSRSYTIVGDRAQARHGFTETWQERLETPDIHPALSERRRCDPLPKVTHRVSGRRPDRPGAGPVPQRPVAVPHRRAMTCSPRRGYDTCDTVLTCYSGTGFNDDLAASAAAGRRTSLVGLDRIYQPT
jgi:hypothetical protein